MNVRYTSPSIGKHTVEADQPPLSNDEQEVVRRFHELYYRRWLEGADTMNLNWFGHQLLKTPMDLWVYQEILVRTLPDVVVETGTWSGGSALYLAMIFDRLEHGEVITIDVEPKVRRPDHPRITYMSGSSTDPKVVERVRNIVGTRRAMIILDSDHRAAHVRAELKLYSPLVHLEDYLIVEDTNVNGHPAYPDYGPGPMEALEDFLAESNDFVIDHRCERFLLTMNPSGYLIRRNASRDCR